MPGSARKEWKTVIFAGEYQLKATAGGGILTYTDVSWLGSIENPPFDLWEDNFDMSSSSDGTRMIVGTYPTVYMWANNGLGWIAQDLPEEEWTSVSMSGDGAYASAVSDGGYVYVYNPNPTPNTTGNIWRWFDSVGTREWYEVDMSESGQHVYAAVYGGYIYGSSDYGYTWKRDVSPSSYETWVGLVVRNGGGAAITDGGQLFRLSIGSPSVLAPTLVSKQQTLGSLAWRGVDISYDGVCLEKKEGGGGV